MKLQRRTSRRECVLLCLSMQGKNKLISARATAHNKLKLLRCKLHREYVLLCLSTQAENKFICPCHGSQYICLSTQAENKFICPCHGSQYICLSTQAENKFKCPCHGSQYNAEGKVVRGPAPLSLVRPAVCCPCER
jgi:Rieske Fe-S protein